MPDPKKLPLSDSVAAVSVKIPARKHSVKSANVVPVEDQWDGLVVCHGDNGMQQWDAHVATPGAYYIHAYYASAGPRPVTLTINSRPQPGKFLARATGGYHKAHLAWETLGPFEMELHLGHPDRLTATGSVEDDILHA